MADKLYEGKGKTPVEAKEDLFNRAGTEGVTDLEGTVSYEVSIVSKRGKLVSGKPNPIYELAFASALLAAKLNPDKFDPKKNPYEVTTKATYHAPESDRNASRNPSGCAPNAYSGKVLTDLF